MELLQRQLIFDTIPGRPSSHCATLTECPDGTLLAAWYSGTREGERDVAIMAARYEQGCWSVPVVLHDTPGLSDGNPLLYTLPDGTVVLWFVTIQGHGWSSARPYWRRSHDGGHTWTSPERSSDRDGLMFRCRPLRLSSGRLVLPAYDEITWEGLPLLSDDDGQTWREAGRMTAPAGCIQPAIVALDDGSLLAYLRTGGRGGCVWESRSTDGGGRWSPCIATDLPNPNAGLDLIRLVDGRLLLAYNPVREGRHRLAVALAEPDVPGWHGRDVEHEPGCEFSYPALLQARDGRCHLLYTYRRESIKHVVIDPGRADTGVTSP
ncbi:MAG: exo-alpha-sialidase [Armatimonadetes bacterium]|nr:exo-alpha-sialidase [Armatimonadota bacterium]